MTVQQLGQYPGLITAITSLIHRLDGSIEQFKAQVQLVDGSLLRVNEVWIGGELRKYAYYRLSPTGELLQGWDNAPHHPEVNTYPHHLHEGDAVYPSQVRSLTDVLTLLDAQLQSE